MQTSCKGTQTRRRDNNPMIRQASWHLRCLLIIIHLITSLLPSPPVLQIQVQHCQPDQGRQPVQQWDAALGPQRAGDGRLQPGMAPSGGAGRVLQVTVEI